MEPQQQQQQQQQQEQEQELELEQSVALVRQDEWTVHKELILRMYVSERKQLKDVREIMEREHNFHASTNMYKKKFRQWKINTGRRGWNLRKDQETSVKPNQNVPLSRTLTQPGPLQLAESSLRAIRVDVLQYLMPQLPRGYGPVSSTDDARPFYLTHSLPSPVIAFLYSMAHGIFLNLKENAPSAGAYFEKAFAQIGSIIREGGMMTGLCFLYVIAQSYFRENPEIRQLLIKQLYGMSLQIYGRNSNIVHWARYLLMMPDDRRKEVVEIYSTVAAGAIIQALGRYASVSIAARIRALQIKRFLGRPIIPAEWESIIEDGKKSPQKLELTWRNAVLYYCNAISDDLEEHQKVEDMTREFTDRLRTMKKEDVVSPAQIGTVVTGVTLHACVAAKLGHDVLAEETHLLAIKRAKELGTNPTFTLSSKQEYATFLKSRGRFDDLETVDAEIEADMSEYQLSSPKSSDKSP